MCSIVRTLRYISCSVRFRCSTRPKLRPHRKYTIARKISNSDSAGSGLQGKCGKSSMASSFRFLLRLPGGLWRSVVLTLSVDSNWACCSKNSFKLDRIQRSGVSKFHQIDSIAFFDNLSFSNKLNQLSEEFEK